MSIQFKRYSGSPDSGGAKLNIAYGDTAPEDTSKLWIKSEEPSNISFPVVWNPEQVVEGVTDTGVVISPSTSNIGSAAVGTKIYLFGGYRDYNSLKSIQVFDTTNNTIQTLSTTLPVADNNITVANVGTKIYLFFSDYSIRVFDTTNNTIKTLSTKLSSTVRALYNFGVGVVGTKIYLFGGWQSSSPNAVDAIQVFDTTNNTIQTLSTKLPQSRESLGAAVVGTKIYLFGGESGDIVYRQIYVFDTTNNTIKTLSTELLKSANKGTAAVGNKIYIFGGGWANSTKYNTIQVFDATNNSIKTLSAKLPTYATGINAVTVGTKIYLVNYLNGFYQFTVDVPLSSNDIIVTQEYYSRTFKVMKAPTEVEVACKYVYKGDQNLAKFIDAYLYDGANWQNVNTGNITFTKLYDPKISISGKTLTITNDGRNGNKVTNYKVYNGSTLLTTITATTLDLTTVITANGTYNISVIATGTGYTDSNNSNAIEYNYGVYNITTNLTNVTANASNPTTVSTVASSTLTFTASTGYNLPDNVTVTGAEFTWTKSSGTLVLSNPTGAVSVTIAGVAISRTITATLTNVTAASGNATTIATGETKVLTYTANSGYNLPDTVSVTGATGVWNKANGTLTLSNPTGNVTFTIAGVAKSYTITPTLTNVTGASGNATSIAVGETKTLTFTAADGYALPDTVTVTGATGTWTKSSGTLVISNPTANVTFTIAGVEAAAVTGYQLIVTESDLGGSATINYKDGTSANVRAGTYQNVVSINSITYTDDRNTGYTLKDANGASKTIPYTLTSDTTLEIYSSECLIEGTQITLADGSTKSVENITYDDELLVWNFYAGRFDTAKPKWIKVAEVAPRYNLVKFSNGSEVGFVGAGGEKGYHRIFNKEAGAFTHTGCKETPNGTTTFAQDNTFPTVVSQEVVKKEVKFYNVITDKHYNLFANGILTSCMLSNKYRIEDMKYVGEKLISDEQEKAYFERIENKRK